MRKLMRSISPFSKKNVTVTDPGPSVPITADYTSHIDDNSSDATPKPTWSVEGINFLQFLQIFYEKFNPEKLSSIDFIYKEYKGEEMVLIYELAEKYNLSQEAMQKILNLSKDSQIQINTSPGPSTRGQSGPPSYSTTNGSIQNESHELHSVVAPNWQSKRVDRDRTSFRNVSPYVPRSAVADSMGIPTTRQSSSEEFQSKSGAAGPPPMSLQDIIQTTRQNDLLAKKSVRFSVTEPDSEAATGDEILSENGSRSSLQSGANSSSSSLLLSTKRVSNFGSSPSPSLSSSSATTAGYPIVPETNLTPRSRAAGTGAGAGASSLQARIRSSLVTQSLDLSTNGNASASASNGASGNDNGLSPNHSPQSIQSDSLPLSRFSHSTMRVNDPSFGSRGAAAAATAESQATTAAAAAASAARIQELEAELEMIKLRLHESENEREDLLKLLEDSWNSPQQVLRIVRSFLERYDRRAEPAELLHEEPQSSFGRIEDLEGRRQQQPYRVSSLLLLSSSLL
jgi:hypothetical protein